MDPPALTKPSRGLVALLSALVLAWACYGVVFAVRHEPTAWFMLGFEIVNIVASAMGLLLARGRFGQAPALGLLCIAGAIGAGTLFGRVSVVAQPGIGTLLRDPWVLGRGALAGLMLAVAAFEVLRRDGRSWGSLARGVLLSIGALGVVVIALAARRRGWLAPIDGPLEIARLVAMFFGALVLGIVFSVGVHLVIRAFEFGRCGETDTGSSPTTPGDA